MTDQANEQSAQDASPAEHDEADLAAFFASQRGEQPDEGQATITDEADAQEQSDEALNAEPQTGKIKVPKLEGEGFEELDPDELRTQRLMHADYTRKTQALADQRKQVEAKAREVEQMANQRLQAMDDHLAQLARTIQSFETQTDWDAVREVDPALYIQEREKQAHRLQAFNRAKQLADEARANARKQRAAEEAQKLVEAIPEWLDKSKAVAEAEKIRTGLGEYGMSPQEVDELLDHRLVLMARDAVRYRELQRKAAEVKQTVAKAPPIARPGGTTNQGNPQALHAHRAIQKATQTGSVDDMAAAFAAMRRGR